MLVRPGGVGGHAGGAEVRARTGTRMPGSAGCAAAIALPRDGAGHCIFAGKVVGEHCLGGLSSLIERGRSLRAPFRRTRGRAGPSEPRDWSRSAGAGSSEDSAPPARRPAGHPRPRSGPVMRWTPGIAVLGRDRVEDVGDPGVHHEFGGVAGMVGQGLDAHDIAVRDGEHGGQRRVEIAPMHSRGRSPQARAAPGAGGRVRAGARLSSGSCMALPPLAYPAGIGD